jgi:DNA-binding beta-propeller fold protein YncE
MLKKAGTLLLICASLATWISCGKTTNHFVYAAINASNEIYVFREDPNSGVLTQLSLSPIGAGVGIQTLLIHPSNKYLYASNSGEGDVSLFAISSDGALNEVLPRTPVGVGPTAMVMDSAGAYLYVANSGGNSVSVFSIGSGGALTPVLQGPQGSGSGGGTGSTQASVGLVPLDMAIDPTGSILYITGNGTLGSEIQVFSLNAGVLTSTSGSPYQTGTDPQGVVVSPSGANVYTANTNDDSVSEFTSASGALTPVAGSPFGGSTFASPNSLYISKTGGFLCVTNKGSSNISVYAIASDGSLSVISASPFASVAAPSVIAGDPNGEYIFVGNQQAGQTAVQSFAVTASSGILTAIASYKLPGTATSIVVLP